MSENAMTQAIYDAFDCAELVGPVTTALAAGLPASGRAAVASPGHWAWAAPPRRRGADLVVTDGDDRLLLIVENKLAGGPAQWCPASFGSTSTAVAAGQPAADYHARLLAAVADPVQMPQGTEGHELAGCDCLWNGSIHGRLPNGKWAPGIPQLDYYAHYRDWLPDWIVTNPAGPVGLVLLSGRPVDPRKKWPGLDSTWHVTTHRRFLNRLAERTAVNGLSAPAQDALDRILLETYRHLPWTQVGLLDGTVKAHLVRLGLPVTPSRASAAAR